MIPNWAGKAIVIQFFITLPCPANVWLSFSDLHPMWVTLSYEKFLENNFGSRTRKSLCLCSIWSKCFWAVLVEQALLQGHPKCLFFLYPNPSQVIVLTVQFSSSGSVQKTKPLQMKGNIWEIFDKQLLCFKCRLHGPDSPNKSIHFSGLVWVNEILCSFRVKRA